MAWWKRIIDSFWEWLNTPSGSGRRRIQSAEKELNKDLAAFLKKSPSPKTYKSVLGSSLICTIADDRGNVVITKDVSESLVVTKVEGDRVFFTNVEIIEFPPIPFGVDKITSVNLLGVKEDGTPYVTTIPIDLIQKR